ncbi:1-phosphofructokinase family hexose kinase [Pseudomonas sp. S5(2021)]|jgi:6-phosphofructokinase 2|nr:1-phosphofructokinase family hexose kinase [Pseudomonas sp. S5(2021)]
MSVSTSICTFTANPALDIATKTERVTPTDKLRCGEPRHDPGGGGINVARVIHVLGGGATAVYPAGGPPGQMLATLLEERAIPQHVVPITGQTRESFTVDEASTGKQFRFVLPGPALSPGEQQHCLDALAAQKPRFIVASGSLPPGVPFDFYARIARLAGELGAKFILDTSGEGLRQAGREGVYLIKPNLRELGELVGRELPRARDQERAAQQLLDERRRPPAAGLRLPPMCASGVHCGRAQRHRRVAAGPRVSGFLRRTCA